MSCLLLSILVFYYFLKSSFMHIKHMIFKNGFLGKMNNLFQKCFHLYLILRFGTSPLTPTKSGVIILVSCRLYQSQYSYPSLSDSNICALNHSYITGLREMDCVAPNRLVFSKVDWNICPLCIELDL